ncbi:hypothetical protein PENSUB_9782 [Penicillium subrubescens]|uniref:Uncharacterized protein n=1 Tax=Penicillium subrubescens TaxID=1316194 RepID=A0A1Q5TCA5_9EURO|nr:hypothetical protein PENSUB_9782 [Penicillium subrubescens]
MRARSIATLPVLRYLQNCSACPAGSAILRGRKLVPSSRSGYSTLNGGQVVRLIFTE